MNRNSSTTSTNAGSTKTSPTNSIPRSIDLTYSSQGDLDAQLTDLLQRYRIHPAVVDRMGRELVAAKASGEDLQVMLTGLPYFGDLPDFETAAKWGAILVTPAERHRFVDIFNDVSYRTDDIKEQGAYLAHHLPPDTRAGSLWKSYVDLITAMEYARRELAGTPYAAASSRPYQRGRSTTWLRIRLVQLPTHHPARSQRVSRRRGEPGSDCCALH